MIQPLGIGLLHFHGGFCHSSCPDCNGPCGRYAGHAGFHRHGHQNPAGCSRSAWRA